jgi:hypothetical protein
MPVRAKSLSAKQTSKSFFGREECIFTKVRCICTRDSARAQKFMTKEQILHIEVGKQPLNPHYDVCKKTGAFSVLIWILKEKPSKKPDSKREG